MEGRIAQGEQAEMTPWEPVVHLRKISHEDARFSRGFLSAPPSAWFDHLREHWLPLFHTVSCDVSVTAHKRGFRFPDQLFRRTVAEVDGEPIILGMDESLCRAVVARIAPEMPQAAEDVVLEYVERRLLSTLSKSWTGSDPLRVFYNREQWSSREVELAGSVGLGLEVDGSAGFVWFGLGPRLLEKLDAQWRSLLLVKARARGLNPLSDQIRTVSVELAELAVPPAMLIDYMRSGTVIDLQVPVSASVRMRVDEKIWAEGELCIFNGSYAVIITDTAPRERAFPDATTRVRIEIAATELDEESLIELSQQRAVMVTDSPASPHASLVISGEHVAAAVVGQIAGRFGLRVLPR